MFKSKEKEVEIPKKKNQITKSKDLKKGVNKKRDLTQLAMSILIIIMINFVGSFYIQRFDLTSEKRYTLSSSSIELANDLKDLVYVKVYLEGSFPGAPGFKRLSNETRELLNQFRAYAKNNIQYEFIDPNSISDKNQKDDLFKQLVDKGVQPTNLEVKGEKGNSQQIIFPAAIVRYNGRETVWPLLKRQMGVSADEQLNNSIQSLEYEFTNAIRILNKIQKTQVAFIDGQHEIDTLHLGDIANALGEYYDVRRINIRGALHKLDQFKAIIIAKPDSIFDEHDKFIIDQFVMHGGKVLWVLDGVQTSIDSLRKTGMTIGLPANLNLDDQLFKYGVRLNANLVEDIQCSSIPVNKALAGEQPKFEMSPWIYSPLVMPVEQHPIVKNLDLIKFEFTSSIDTIDVKGIKKTILLRSSRYTKLVNAPMRISLAMVNMRPREEQFRQPPQALAVLLEGEFESLYKNRTSPALDSIKKDVWVGYKERSPKNKMIVISDGDIIRNNVDGKGTVMPLGYDFYTRQMFGNKIFILNCINWMCDDEGLMSVRSRNITLRMLNKKKIVAEALQWQFINTGIPILIILLMGSILFFIRKRKYAH